MVGRISIHGYDCVLKFYMSRSRKAPYITAQSTGCSKLPKRKANKAVRSLSNESTPKNGKAYKKESCSWNINDFSFYSPKIKKAFRK